MSVFFLVFAFSPSIIYAVETSALENLRERMEQQEQVENDNQATQEQRQKAQRRVEEAKEEVQTVYSEGSTDELQRAFTELEELSGPEKIEITRELSGRKSCGDNWWSFVCNLVQDSDAKDLQVRRAREQIARATSSSQDLEEYNSNLMQVVNSEIQTYLSGLETCNAPSSDCKSQIENYECPSGDTNCEIAKQGALDTFNEGLKNYRVERTGLLKAAEFLNVDDSSYALADQIQDLVGFELSLIEEGSGVDEILSYGTPEQVCLAKVDSFMSVKGVDVDGKTYDAPEQSTGFTTRQKACDNQNFEICADLRAEKSQLLFENRFNIIVHFYVYNAKEHEQEFIINAELTNDNNERVNFNVFENTTQVDNKSITLQPGQRESMTIMLDEISPFDSKDYSEVYGNVILSVHKKVDGGGGVFDASNLDYAIDYPIMSIRGSSNDKNQRKKDVENSGAQATDGVSDASTFSSTLVDRVNLN